VIYIFPLVCHLRSVGGERFRPRRQAVFVCWAAEGTGLERMRKRVEGRGRVGGATRQTQVRGGGGQTNAPARQAEELKKRRGLEKEPQRSE
jgi:hypothetical protein